MSKYLPFENLTYETSLSQQEVMQRLQENTEPRKLNFFYKKREKAYEGSIAYDSFQISRIITYRNSFLPYIKGQVVAKPYGAEIQIKMRLHATVIAFLIVWCGLVGLAFVGFLFQSLQAETFNYAIVVPFVMLVFVYLLATLPFHHESRKSKRFFNELFETPPVDRHA